MKSIEAWRPKTSPGRCRGFACWKYRRRINIRRQPGRQTRSSELVVQANAPDVRSQIDRMGEDVGRESDRGGEGGQVGARRAGPAQINVKIFGLNRPAIHQRIFAAATGGPAIAGFVARSRYVSRRNRVGE